MPCQIRRASKWKTHQSVSIQWKKWWFQWGPWRCRFDPKDWRHSLHRASWYAAAAGNKRHYNNSKCDSSAEYARTVREIHSWILTLLPAPILMLLCRYVFGVSQLWWSSRMKEHQPDPAASCNSRSRRTCFSQLWQAVRRFGTKPMLAARMMIAQNYLHASPLNHLMQL